VLDAGDAAGVGKYPPTSWLPSESQLIAQRGVSRRTVRDAIAELRAQGLIAVVDGKGAYVRPATELARHTHTRTVTRTGSTYADTATEGWTEIEKPTTYREDASAEIAQLLGVPTRSTLSDATGCWPTPPDSSGCCTGSTCHGRPPTTSPH